MSHVLAPNELIHAVEVADSADALLDAVEALAEANSIDAIPTLIEVLGFNNPGASVAAVDGLIEIGEPSVVPLLQLIDTYNYTARSWAVRALAGIGDPRGLDILCHAATSDFSASVRRAAARGLGTLQWQLVEEAAIATTRARVLEALTTTIQDEEWVVRYASVVGVHQLAQSVAPSASPCTRSTVDPKVESAFYQKVRGMLVGRAVIELDIAVHARILLGLQKL